MQMDSSSNPVKLPLRTVRELWQRGGGTVHMVGVGGVGMAGLAHLLVRAGFQVSGCDVQEGPLLEWLRGQGVAVSIGIGVKSQFVILGPHACRLF